MADLKISALTSATTPLAGTEVLPIVQSSTTVKVAVNDMLGTQSYTSPAVDSNGNVFLRATDTLGTGVGTQMMMGGKYNASAYVGFGGVAGRKENASSGNLAGYLDLLTCSSGGTIASRWRVDSAGNFNQRIAGIGVNFTANTPAAGMTSQLLNWYEEGTWTPVVTAAVGSITTVGAVSGTYTRIGRQVTLGFKIEITVNGTGSNSILIAGIPFSPPAINLYAGVAYESVVTGALCSIYWSSVTELRMANYAGIYPATNGSTFTGTITYFV